MINKEAPSKTRRKRDAHALQDLATALLAYPESALRKVNLPDNVLDALLQAQGIRAREARRRQLQYIGKLVRREDPAILQTALQTLEGTSAAQAQQQRILENWREKILVNPQAIEEFAQQAPHVDISRLQTLRAHALQEHAHNRPPEAARALYRLLKSALTSTDDSSA